jgi:23S rRNA (pseudouridine1915-N3)-methyltransferase
MKLHIIAAGKPALTYAKVGIADYELRLRRYTNIKISYLKSGDSLSVSHSLLEKSLSSYRIALDERGHLLTTSQIVEKFDKFELDGSIKELSFLIGAADGHSPELRDKSRLIWALSPLTLQHELALLVLMEQLYRVYTIKNGEPYHR